MKLDMIEKHPEKEMYINKEISEIDESLNTKINQTMNEAIQEDIHIQNY